MSHAPALLPARARHSLAPLPSPDPTPPSRPFPPRLTQGKVVWVVQLLARVLGMSRGLQAVAYANTLEEQRKACECACVCVCACVGEGCVCVCVLRWARRGRGAACVGGRRRPTSPPTAHRLAPPPPTPPTPPPPTPCSRGAVGGAAAALRARVAALCHRRLLSAAVLQPHHPLVWGGHPLQAVPGGWVVSWSVCVCSSSTASPSGLGWASPSSSTK